MCSSLTTGRRVPLGPEHLGLGIATGRQNYRSWENLKRNVMQVQHLECDRTRQIHWLNKQHDSHACGPLTFMKALFSRAFIITGGMAEKTIEIKQVRCSASQATTNTWRPVDRLEQSEKVLWSMPLIWWHYPLLAPPCQSSTPPPAWWPVWRHWETLLTCYRFHRSQGYRTSTPWMTGEKKQAWRAAAGVTAVHPNASS